MAHTILVVDDEPNIRLLLHHELSRHGYRVLAAEDGLEALAMLDEQVPDLVLLDMMLPRLPGLDVLRQIKARGPIPVIMLTARQDEIDRVVGLELGADDYVTKPFSLKELVARIQALFRRLNPGPLKSPIACGSLYLDPARREARLNGCPLELTATEFALLTCLAQEPGRVFSRRELFRRVWGMDDINDTRTVTVHIRNLRAKLPEPAPRIETVRGVGYRLALEAAARETS
ncbi:MAG: response regulator transcription factor [Firmicutes bacterium]|nr:response regulator transcription factor [Bacillota bacterium]